MKSWRPWLVFGGLGMAVVALGSWIAARGSEGSGPSTMSRRASGWLIARAYLEARGAEVHLLDRPFEPSRVRGTLVVAFPWQRRELSFDAETYVTWVRRGGRLVIGYGGRLPDLSEHALLAELDSNLSRHRSEEAGSFAEWKRWRDEVWRLEPSAVLGPGAKPVLLRGLEETHRADDSLRVLYGRSDDVEHLRPVVWAQALGKGTIVFLPNEVLANGRLSEPGNADLLETLHVWLGPVWTFDEYHHGLAAPGARADPVSTRVFDASLGQMALLYVLAAWASVRRLGRAWREPPVRAGSVAPFLVGLGRLHHRLGHHAEAARLLLKRWRELDRKLDHGLGSDAERDKEWAARADAADGKGLVALAGELLQQRDRRKRWT